MESSLLSMCMASFAAVFLVLTFLAIAMRLIIVIFPEKQEDAGADETHVSTTADTATDAPRRAAARDAPGDAASQGS